MEMTITNRTSHTLTLVGSLLLLLAASGCDSLLDVESDPQVIDADQPVSLEATLAGATSDFFTAYDSKIVWGGLFGDEFAHSGTAPSIRRFDRRDVLPDHGGGGERANTIGGPFYVPQQRAVRVAVLAQERIEENEFEQISNGVNSAEYARFSMYEAFGKTWLADLYCTLAFAGDGPELSSEEVYLQAEEAFTQAIEASDATTEVRQASLVGRARVRLITGQTEGALADAREVNPAFELQAIYSTNSFAERNRVHFRTWDFGNWSVGPSFRDLTLDETSQDDPRVELVLNPTPAFDSSQDLYAPQKVSSANSPLMIASGDEAQYIIAELVLGEEAVDIINEVRERNGVTYDWTPSGEGANEIRDKVIDERKRTLFLEGVRLGDLRRYIEQYGLNFFPTTTPQGFEVGDQTCLPLPNIERNNNPGI